MALIRCPDCRRKISEAAVSCINCGRPIKAMPPRQAQSDPESTTDTPTVDDEISGSGETQRTRAKDLNRERLQDQFDSAVESARSSLNEAGAWLQGAASLAFDSMTRTAQSATVWKEQLIQAISRLTESSVPTFILPTGADPADFVCAFDFRQFLEAAKRGIITRPRIHAWAGRADLDRAKLRRTLAEQFLVQFNDQRTAFRQEYERGQKARRKALVKVEREKSDAEEQVQGAVSIVFWSLLALLFFSNPLVDLVFLSLALLGGTSATANVLRHLKLSRNLKVSERSFEKAREKVKGELADQEAALQTAIDKLEIRCHPLLEGIVEDLCELENRSFVPVPVKRDADAPDARPYLVDSGYRATLPTWIIPLLDERIDHSGAI